MIQQVLTNLVSNAIRHDTGAGVSIRAFRTFRRGAEGTWLRFEVANHGSGLRLAISRRLIEALDGRIGFRRVQVIGAASRPFA